MLNINELWFEIIDLIVENFVLGHEEIQLLEKVLCLILGLFFAFRDVLIKHFLQLKVLFCQVINDIS